MSSDMHYECQTTKKYNLPLTHLEYSYIEKCTNVKELEKIIYVLRSGEEGKFPDLEMFAEKRLETLNPKSHALRKECPVLRQSDLDSGDWKTIEDDLKNWTNYMHEKDSHKSKKSAKDINVVEGDENLPPVRSSDIVLEGKKQKKPEENKKKKTVAPRDYKDWEKLDIDAELKAVDGETKKVPKKAKLNGVSLDLDTTGMSEEEKSLKANREKDKGNEAFRSQDFKEAVAYYSRSITLMPTAASYNNRALAYLKVKKWDKAIKDCNSVLNIETNNIKALMRRGTAYKSKKDFRKAAQDLEKVLTMEPNNKRAEDLLKEVKNGLTEEEKDRKERGGRRMVIDEIDSEEEEATEEIEVDKPMSNECSVDNQSKNIDPPTGLQAKETEKIAESKTFSEVGAPKSSAEVPAAESTSESKQALNKLSDQPEPLGSGDPEAAVPRGLDEEVAPKGLNEDNSCLSLEKSLTCPPSLTPPSSETCALEAPSNVSEVSPNTVNESSPERSQAALQETQEPAESSTQNHFTCPQFVQLPLSPAVSNLKEEGNKLFRSGQYGEAMEWYSQAITQLEKDPDQKVNLSMLLSNRAACHLKTGNLSQTISDCNRSLQIIPHREKVLLRRAAAYETLEKYGEAYVDYKHVTSLNNSAHQAHQGASRCQSMVQSKYGPTSWREKIPPLVIVRSHEVPLIVGQDGLHRSLSSTVSLADQDKMLPVSDADLPKLTEEKVSLSEFPRLPTSSSTEQQPLLHTQKSSLSQSSLGSAESKEVPVVQRSKEEEFEHMKATGNQHVQKGKYQEAAECYSTCISLCPDQVACYTNRALCYLKLNKVNEAEIDCDKALSIQSVNPKALYRRALARKMLHKFKLSLQDLIELLKLEPKNTAAQKEMDTVKMLYKEELEALKKKTAAEQESKTRKRIKIEEVDDEEEEDKPKLKATDKSKPQGKSRNSKQAQQSPGSKSKTNNGIKKSNQTSNSPSLSQPMAPPVAPRLMKTTPYEFYQAWNSLKSCQSIQPYAAILRQISPADLPSVISNKLDGQMLQVIVRCVYEEMVQKSDIDLGYQILDRLCQVQRFSTVSMFMTSKEKKEVATVLDILSKTTSSAYGPADIVRLKKEYSVK